MVKKRIVFAALILLVSFGLVSADIVEEIVAIVNGDVITLSDYKEQFDSTVQILRQQLSGESYFREYDRLKDNLLDMMITDLLLLQKAKEQGLNIKEQLKATIAQIKAQNNIESDADLIRAMNAQGIDYEQWVKQLEENMIRQAVIYTEVDRTIALDDAEIVKYYKQHQSEFVIPPEYRIKAIYLSSVSHTVSALEAKRAEITNKLKSGLSFEDLVQEYSEGPKDNGGDLGFFKKGELDKAIEAGVEKLKPGEISNWIEAKNGWYLIKLEEKKESHQQTFEEARKDIEEKLYNEIRAKKIEEYVKKLKEESFVKILKPNPLNL
ncbi:MAG TPA: peptidyl-prolyl cis-trans isomerase [Candidatus Saccharicenans sp.]|nr:peptidyl-prolyl cis-trans isomerase [Candidatus Saccharicenans sp.]HRD02492.1 peptidyl-prolyl cis-trans isomerase [Candidatus Saccharicenans sp.]